MKEWKNCTLGELGNIVGGATPSTKKFENYEGGTIPWITPKDLSGFLERYIAQGERNITEAGLRSCSAQLLPKHSILFSSRAPIGYIAIAACEVCTNQGFKSIIPNNDVDYMFLYYLLKFKKGEIENMGSGTTFKEVSAGVMKNIQVRVPAEKSVQIKIAKILSSLDDKIELNNRINDNLEQQAQAIFKSWFIDYEPFNGKIPSTWKEYRLADFLPVVTGKKNANVSSDNGHYPFFSCSQNIAWTDNYSFEGNAILVAGNGDFNVKWYNGKFEAYQRTYVLIPYNPRYSSWLYYAVKYNLAKITSAARGSVIRFITKGNLENFSFLAPRELDKYEIIDTFSTINHAIEQRVQENYRLQALRDNLLPRLMSGEIDISDIKI
ncbi:restriction endonuclease subunit S [Akkermansia muciniphila]|uniref:restriction endonuclease subunit S n=1 Tax=Akkermansia muciniphila TaxID=239935 RepID=UPI000F0B69A4|nr:restriction endonuclease subunit S [Akkermansia muciniphila]AYR28512.1 restriction endonuclease subunit S [Akkermansia muciniphila]